MLADTLPCSGRPGEALVQYGNRSRSEPIRRAMGCTSGGREASTPQAMWRRRLRLASFIAVLLLPGCVTWGTFTYFQPSGDGKLASSNCYAIPNEINVPIAEGVRLLFSAEQGLLKDGRYSDAPGTTLSATLYVIPGVRARILTPTFTVQASSGERRTAPISPIDRTILYGPAPDSSLRMATEHLSSGDVMPGWTEADARASGLIPPDSYVQYSGDLLNGFMFHASFAGFVSRSFIADLPGFIVDGKQIAGKRIGFTLVTSREWSVSCP